MVRWIIIIAVMRRRWILPKYIRLLVVVVTHAILLMRDRRVMVPCTMSMVK
jgi:hypothetical protein